MSDTPDIKKKSRWVRTEQEAERRRKAAEEAAWRRWRASPTFDAQVAACAEEERICEGRT